MIAVVEFVLLVLAAANIIGWAFRCDRLERRIDELEDVLARAAVNLPE